VAHFRLSTIYRQTGRSAEAKHELEEYQKYKGMKEKASGVLSKNLHRAKPAKKTTDVDTKK